MDGILEIYRDHEFIEMQLQEIEFIATSDIINYPNLIHTITKLRSFWEEHEKREELLFSDLEFNGFKIPVKKIEFEHGRLKNIWNKLVQAIESGSELKLKEELESTGKILITEIREHINKEEWILRSINLSSLG